MDISLLTLLVGLALGTFFLGFIFARLAKLAQISSPAPQLATEGASASTPAIPEPADVLTQTQLHYQQTHINGQNATIRMLEEKRAGWSKTGRKPMKPSRACSSNSRQPKSLAATKSPSARLNWPCCAPS